MVNSLKKLLKDDIKDCASIPLHYVSPLFLTGDMNEQNLSVPLATHETPLWPSVERGFRVTQKSDGIHVAHHGQLMARSFILNAPDTKTALEAVEKIKPRDFQTTISTTSRFAKFKSVYTETVGRHIFVRLGITTGDAAGHNMVTKAAQAVLKSILNDMPQLEYGTISGNICIDKKTSAINAFFGRGHNVKASAVIPENICKRMLRTTPQRLKDLHVQKNLLGSILAGSIRSANAHVANMLLGFYLATGQDAANIVEGSQAITHIDVLENGDLEISCHCPSLVVGTVGNGKDMPHVLKALETLGCLPDNNNPGTSSKKLAMICAATCLAGELSLLAAQTNPDELLASHEALERRHKTR